MLYTCTPYVQWYNNEKKWNIIATQKFYTHSKCLEFYKDTINSFYTSKVEPFRSYSIIYDFLSAKQTILSNVWIDFNLTQFRFLPTFDMNWHT